VVPAQAVVAIDSRSRNLKHLEGIKLLLIVINILHSKEMKNQSEELIAHYQKALVIKPNNAKVHSELGKLYDFQGNFEEATYHYIQAIQFNPANLLSYWNLKYALIAINWFGRTVDRSLLDKGIDTLRSIVQNQPDFFLPYRTLGDLLTQKGAIEEAISCYKTASYKYLVLSKPELAEKDWNPDQKRNPNFLILGFMRSGTTSLYAYLTCHPQIIPASDKELHFFTNFFDRGIEWYLSHFSPIADGVDYLTGEATPTYINSPGVANKVFELFPTIKLIVLLRNPVDRVISAISLHKPPGFNSAQLVQGITDGLDKAQTLINSMPDALAIENSSVVNCDLDHRGVASTYHLLSGLYIFHIKEWLTIFPKNQLLMINSKDFFSNPSKTMKEVHGFLNIPNYQLATYDSYALGTRSLIPDELRRQLVEFYRPYNEQLEEYLGMKFNWE